MGKCDAEKTIEWTVTARDSGYGTREQAKEAGENAIKKKVKLEVTCEGDDCADSQECQATYDDDEADALIHTFSYDGGGHGYRIRKGSKLKVTCACVKAM